MKPTFIVLGLLALLALLFLLAACDGGSASSGSGGSVSSRPGGSASSGSGGAASAGGAPSAVGYSQCVRSHGVARFPDPASNGALPKTGAQQLGVSDSVLQAAQSACRHLLPATASLQQQAQQCFQAGACPPALVQQLLTAQRRFAVCMRSHGVPNWPDPSVDAEGRPVFNLVPAGITHSEEHAPPIAARLTTCQRLDPAPAAMESN